RRGRGRGRPFRDPAGPRPHGAGRSSPGRGAAGRIPGGVSAGQSRKAVPEPTQLVRLAGSLLEEYVDELRTLVDVDCGSFTPAGVNTVADAVQSRFQGLGWTVDRRPHLPGPEEPQLGDVLVATLQGSMPAADGGRRVLLVGHMDTVFPEGTASERPFRIEGDIARGPGVSDMKGGLLTGLYA